MLSQLPALTRRARARRAVRRELALPAPGSIRPADLAAERRIAAAAAAAAAAAGERPFSHPQAGRLIVISRGPAGEFIAAACPPSPGPAWAAGVVHPGPGGPHITAAPAATAGQAASLLRSLAGAVRPDAQMLPTRETVLRRAGALICASLEPARRRASENGDS